MDGCDRNELGEHREREYRKQVFARVRYHLVRRNEKFQQAGDL